MKQDRLGTREQTNAKLTVMEVDGKENKMVSERTLRKWRKEVLTDTVVPSNCTLVEVVVAENAKLKKYMLQLTQELMDIHLKEQTK